MSTLEPVSAAGPVGFGEAPAASSAPRYGGFWRRFWAMLVDRFVLGTVLGPVVFIGFSPVLTRFADGGFDDGGEVLHALVPLLGVILLVVPLVLLAIWLYYALLQSSSKQATLGYMLLGMKVTDLEGRRISFLRATARHFLHILSGMLFGIGFLMVAFTSRKQALHDLIAGTLVMRS